MSEGVSFDLPGGCCVVVVGEGAVLRGPEAGQEVPLRRDSLRWLVVAAGPAALAVLEGRARG